MYTWVSYITVSCGLLTDVYSAVCFWTVFTALSVQLFYWSVWKLGKCK